MVVNTKEIIMKVKRMDKVNIHGKMVVIIKVDGEIIKLMVLGLMYGLMEDNIKVIGWIIRCMVKVVIDGKMEEVIKENINMIKNMVLVLILGLMEENIVDNGLIVKDMDMVKLYQLMVLSDKVYGKKIGEWDGWMFLQEHQKLHTHDVLLDLSIYTICYSILFHN